MEGEEDQVSYAHAQTNANQTQDREEGGAEIVEPNPTLPVTGFLVLSSHLPLTRIRS